MSPPDYFGNRMTAERYAAARPDVHSVALSNFVAFAQLKTPIPQSLDVGCGTGQSSRALSELSDHVIGVDPSLSMLAAAVSERNLVYGCAKAEALPFLADAFDLVMVAQAFHWFDQEAFLGEACRVLKDEGWLLIYTAGFTGEMTDDAGFLDWFRTGLLERYPTPPRGRRSVGAKLARRHGFALRGEERYSLEVGMSLEGFTDYQLSTTNLTAAVGDSVERFETAEHWIRDELARFFGEEIGRTFVFAGHNWYLQKSKLLREDPDAHTVSRRRIR